MLTSLLFTARNWVRKFSKIKKEEKNCSWNRWNTTQTGRPRVLSVVQYVRYRNCALIVLTMLNYFDFNYNIVRNAWLTIFCNFRTETRSTSTHYRPKSMQHNELNGFVLLSIALKRILFYYRLVCPFYFHLILSFIYRYRLLPRSILNQKDESSGKCMCGQYTQVIIINNNWLMFFTVVGCTD